MAGKSNMFSRSIFVVVTLTSLLNDGVLCHHIEPCSEDDASPDCDRSYLSTNQLSGPLTATDFIVKYTLYTEPTANKVHSFNSENFETEMKNIAYNRGAQWKVLVHGFLNNGMTSFPLNVRDAYLNKMAKNGSAKYNVLVVDWGAGACVSVRNLPVPYRNAAENVQAAGQKLGQLLSKFHNAGILDVSKDVHLIGHSLGAHVCGQAAREIHATLNVLLYRISALDAAGPLFWKKNLLITNKPFPRIRRNRVLFLDAYHTSWMFGGEDEIGDVDFYINGGESQPSCDIRILGIKLIPDLFTQVCSHNSATDMFAKSIEDDTMKACTGCYSYSEYEKLKCDCEDYPVLGESVVEDTIEGFPIASGTAYIKTKLDYTVGSNYLQMVKNNGIFDLLWKGWEALCF